ncbi:MAG: hypothetical protein DDT30_01426 [Dehalococcoidia bacterium]|nr:hypothetical protein [Bacillota bacterium]
MATRENYFRIRSEFPNSMSKFQRIVIGSRTSIGNVVVIYEKGCRKIVAFADFHYFVEFCFRMKLPVYIV